MKIGIRLVSFCVAAVFASTVTFAQVTLQNATATFSQSFNGPWNASEMIDGNFDGQNGWAIFDNTTVAQTAVFETVSDLTAGGIDIAMSQNYASFPGHYVGRFRWSYTTDSRGDFADGLQLGGDVSANWTVLTPMSVSAPGFSSSILGDGSVLMSYATGVPSTATYSVSFGTALSGVTGLRLEVLEDASLATNGPGMYSTNGNFVLTEVTVDAVPEPATMVLLGSGVALMLRRRNRKS